MAPFPRISIECCRQPVRARRSRFSSGRNLRRGVTCPPASRWCQLSGISSRDDRTWSSRPPVTRPRQNTSADVLEAGIPVIMASAGAPADPRLFECLASAAQRGGSTLTLPAGAIGGLDYLRAVARDHSTRVCYTARKPPASFREELATLGHDADALSSETVLFEGTAVEAAHRYPRNLNVAFSIALAVGLRQSDGQGHR